jgi:hypothetical protein
MRPVIGIDFDNTLVSYDELIHHVALERGLILEGAAKSKREVRDVIRLLPDGETEWQRVQGLVYGPRMHRARPTDGVEAFLRRCADTDARVYVVSHKTQFARRDDTRTDVRAAALSWMDGQGWFDGTGSRLSRANVYFEPTRREKLERIGHLGCTHFIDDLEETFLDDRFPTDVRKVLYAPRPTDTGMRDVAVASSWEEAGDYIFGGVLSDTGQELDPAKGTPAAHGH